MKTIVRLFVIFACMLATMVQAQVTTTITPKVQLFPSSGLSYVEDPTQYFNVIMTNTGPETRQIYVSFRVSCDFSATGGSFFLQSPGNMAPPQPLTLGANETRIITMQDFRMLMSHINGRDIQMSGISWQDALLLPEGNYQICIKTYYWDHAGSVPAPVEAGPEGCCYFTICYSGSAPEFTSPIIGQSGGNINVINPMADQSGSNSNFDASSGSDSRSNSDYTVLTPSRQVVFSWQGVVSNCITNSNVNYILKLVEVMPQQSVYDAIDHNSTIYTVNAGSRTTCIIDTLKDLNATPFQRGHTYAAMVQAVPKNQNMVFQLGNEGKSQIIAFNWGQPLSGPVPRILSPGSNGRTLDSTLSDNKADVLASLRDPYLVMPVVDDDAADVLVGKFPSENANRPQNSLSLIDGLYYRLNDKDKLKVSWLPMRGDSLTKVEYKVNLYEYIGGDVSFSTTRPPLKSYKIEKTNGFGVDNVAFMELPEKWDSVLEHGNKYFLVLEAASHYKYRRTTEYTETVIENGNTTTNKYSKVTIMEGTEFFYSNELFQWGYDSAMLETVDLAQLTYPVDMRGQTADYALGETEIDEVFINSAFKFKWSRADNVLDRDSVTYNLLIMKWKKGKLPSQMKDTLFIYKNLTDNEYIDDAIKDSLKVGSQYVAFVETRIKQTVATDDPYIIPNNGRSWVAAFKIVETEEMTADNDPSAFCPSESWSKLNKKDTLRPKNINDIKGMELNMNGFKVVFQEVNEKTDSIKDKKTKKVTLRKSYYGNGYIVWSPFAMNTRIKVQLDSILFNKDHEVFTGCAKTIAADSTALLPMDFGGKIGDWTEGKINSLYKEVDDNEDVQKYVNYFNKPSYMSIGGLIGAGDASESPAFYLPLKVNSQDFYLPDDGCNVILSINNMYLSPKTALMNLFTLFYSQEDNIYIPMIATNICMKPDAFFAGINEGIDMYLAKDIVMEISDGYNMTLKKASKLGKKDDGTVISFRTKTNDKNSGFDQLNLEFQFDLTSADALHHDNRGVLSINPKTGVPQKGTPVKAGALIVIQDWSDWMARISIDPFALEDFPDMAFVPGRNLWYDHSSKSNPAKFPKDYQSSAGKGPLWQGFFMEDLGFVMSDKIGTVFGAGDTNVKPMYQYSYGPNGEIRDSSEVAFTKQCLGFRIANTIIDVDGFTTDIQGVNIVDASTKDAGSWAFSIDTIGVKVLKGKFNKGYIVGTAQVPLLTGRIGYNCTIATDSLTFGVSTRKKDTLGFDLWLAKLDVQDSYFKLRHLYEATAADSAHPQTAIDLKLNGKINIDFSKLKLPINFSMVKFENFTLRNFKNAKDTNVKRIGDSNLWFYMGDWAKASPQHYLTSNASSDVYKGSIGGFTFSVQTIKPITGMDGTKVKLGFATAIKVGFKTGPKDGSGEGGSSDAFSLDAGCGFKVWGMIDYKTWDFNKNDIGGSVDSVTIETDCFSVFKLKGKLVWIGNENPDPTFGEGMFGTLDITIMDKLEIAMAAAFGTVKKNESEFKWWMFQGAASGFEIPVPPIVFTGFGGGFAYNMTVKPSATLANAKAHNLISGQDGGSLASKMVSGSLSQCEFIPEKDSWVAKAGLSLALANEKLMNADGILTLRVSQGKFSGILIDVSTYILTSPTGDDPTQSAEAKNKNTLIKARALLGYEQTNDYHYFKFALCVKGGIDLSDLLKNSGVTKALDGVKDDLKCIGDDVYKDVTCTFDPLTNVVAIDSTAAKAADPLTYGGDTTNYKPDNGIGAGISFALPIEFEVKSYKKGNSLGKKPGAEWYFCIGKPTKGERVEFSMWANLVVFETRTDFTFYFLTGNSFEYHLPELDPEVHEFFFGGSSGKQVNSSATSTVQSQGQSLENQYKNSPTFANAGGFAMGMTYKSRIKYELFLYVDVMAAFGFDVALLDTKGQSCEGYDHVGKNDFYAMGQLYAMLKGSAGLSINLGFWKGKLELCSLGIGALLKGGGPNPSWAFGLLRLKASLLNGLVSINTSVDFRVGHVCVPGAGDPLANVNFFESVSPGYKDTEAALKSGNELSPIGGGVIVSNMPWDSEITLVTPTADGKGEDARKFIFVMEKNRCSYEISKNRGTTWTPVSKPNYKIEGYPKDNLIQTFEHKDGGFEERALQKWHFTARAYEYRTAFDTKNSKLRDTMYNDKNNFAPQTTIPQVGTWGWFNPKYASDKDSAIHIFRQDTTVYFNIDSLPANLYNQVVYSWPYNGDPSVPKDEVTGVEFYLAKARPELFEQSFLKTIGKEMQCFIIKGYGGLNQNAERCSFGYSSNQGMPRIGVSFPKYNYLERGTPYMIRFILVDIDKAQGAIDALMATQQVSTRTDYELTSQNWDKVYASHQASTSTGRGEGTIHAGDFTAFTNARIEALNDKIQHEAGLANIHDRLTPGGHLGDLFGGSTGTGTGGVLGGTGSGTGTGTGGGLLGGGGDPTITNPGNGSTGTLGRPGRTGVTGTGGGRLTGNVTTTNPGNNVQLTNTSGVILTNSSNLSSGVLANNNLNLDMLGINMGSDAKNMGGMGRTRSANANTNTSSGSGQLYAQYGGQTQQQQASATLSTGNRGGQSQETTSVALVDRNSRNVVKNTTTSSSTLTGGRVVAATSSSSGRGKFQATNVLVESSSVTLPVAGTATSSGFSALGSTNRVVAGEGNQPGKFLGYNVADYTETYTQAEANVEDYMYDKLLEDYTEQGSDTSMLYERNSLEEYAIAYQYGDTIFDFCFKTDPYYDTYEDLFTQVLSCYNGGIESSTTPTANNTLVQYPVRTSSSTSQRFGWYSYLFAPQVPNDKNRYNENVTLPAIATFKLNTDKEHRTAAMAKHLFLYSNFSRMLYYSNKYTKGPLTRIPHQITHTIKDDEFRLNGDWDGIGCAYGYEFFNGNKGGIIREPSNKWKNLDKRSNVLKAWAYRASNYEPFDMRYIYTLDYNAAMYLHYFDSPNTSHISNSSGIIDYTWSYWDVPDILDVKVENSPTIPVITIRSFEASQSKWEDYNGARNAVVNVKINDYATPALYDDIQMFFKFFKKCTEIAAYPLCRGYSHKKAILQILYSEGQANARLIFDDNFPYIINKSLPWTHYFTAWNYIYENVGFNPADHNPEDMHAGNSYYQYYSWLWFHFKKAPVTYSGTKGLTVSLDAGDDRTLPYWYTGMSNMSNVKKPYVTVVYVSAKNNVGVGSQIAAQIKKNLFGSGEINDNAFLFNSELSKSWQLKSYPNYFTNKDKDTDKLTFPDPSSVEQYIDD